MVYLYRLLVPLFLILFMFAKAQNSIEKSYAGLQTERPNIIWLVAEDLSPYLPAFGDSTILTTNLSRLAMEGVRYTNVYSPSGVCAPSRASIITGMYPSGIGANHMRTGSYTEITGLPKYEAVPPANAKMFSELLRMGGYYCTNNAKTDYQFNAPVTAWDENSEQAHWRNRQPNQPFFAVFNFGVTHESSLFEPYQKPIVVSQDIKFPVPPYLPNNAIIQRDLWKVYNNIALLDQQLGKMLQQLEEDGLLEKTIIFFYSDHGGPLPRQKRMLYDAGLKVPMIIRFPNKHKAGTIDDRLISFVDFAPTILELTGQTIPKYLQGFSFKGNDENGRKYIHAAADRFDGVTDVIRAVRDGRFKYLRNYRPEQGYYLPVTYREQIPTMQELLRMREAGELNEVQAQWFRTSKPKEELFDCLNDPNELINLADKPEYAAKLLELRIEMDRWIVEIGDQPNLPERKLVNHLWRGAAEKPGTALPSISKKDGKIHIACPTEGASIGYREVKEGSKPSKSWEIYSGPFEAKAGTILEIQAHRIGFKPAERIKYIVVQ